ncbi:MAG TPA: alpha-L-fucosidase, partial [Bacteroidota bacterium]|nr:alpha-L-fucosidase [Bacteroidota bacterium]
HLLVDIVAKGGNFLLNLAVTAEGDYEPEGYDRLKKIGAWMRVNSEAIYESHPVLPYKDGRVCFTKRGDNTIYAIYLASEDETHLPATFAFTKFAIPDGAEITILGTSVKAAWKKTEAGCEVTIPESVRKAPPCEYAWTLKITY